MNKTNEQLMCEIKMMVDYLSDTVADWGEENVPSLHMDIVKLHKILDDITGFSEINDG